MKHADALKIAEELVERLRPACTRIEIAGSVRRGKAKVKDIEIVAVPDLTPVPRPRAEFGKPIPQWNKTKLDVILMEMFLDGVVEFEKNGEKYKKLRIFKGKDSIAYNLCDLFLVTPPAEWGVQMVIRTGPADFSHWCVTRKSQGGALPDDLIVEDGAVGPRVRGDKGDARHGVILTPEESDFLKVLGLGWIEPGEREARWSR